MLFVTQKGREVCDWRLVPKRLNLCLTQLHGIRDFLSIMCERRYVNTKKSDDKYGCQLIILSLLPSIYPPSLFFCKHQHAPNLKLCGPGEPAPNIPSVAFERSTCNYIVWGPGSSQTRNPPHESFLSLFDGLFVLPKLAEVISFNWKSPDQWKYRQMLLLNINFFPLWNNPKRKINK